MARPIPLTLTLLDNGKLRRRKPLTEQTYYYLIVRVIVREGLESSVVCELQLFSKGVLFTIIPDTKLPNRRQHRCIYFVEKSAVIQQSASS